MGIQQHPTASTASTSIHSITTAIWETHGSPRTLGEQDEEGRDQELSCSSSRESEAVGSAAEPWELLEEELLAVLSLAQHLQRVYK